MKYLLDTNFIIGLHQFDNKVIDLIKSRKIDYQQCAISVITYLEVLGFTGHTEEDKRTLANLLALFTCYELTQDIQQQTINLKQAHKIKLPDTIILATAQVHELELITFDKKLINQSKREK